MSNKLPRNSAGIFAARAGLTPEQLARVDAIVQERVDMCAKYGIEIEVDEFATIQIEAIEVMQIEEKFPESTEDLRETGPRRRYEQYVAGPLEYRV